MKITDDQIIHIEDMVTTLLGNNYNPTAHIEIVPIIEKDGIELAWAAMDADTSGVLILDTEKGIRRIEINNNLDGMKDKDIEFKKSRFIMAHEYGHYKLLLEKISTLRGLIVEHRDRRHRDDIAEQEAEYFARSILMPRKSFETFYKIFTQKLPKNPERVIDGLSTVFQVTNAKVQERINDIKKLQKLSNN